MKILFVIIISLSLMSCGGSNSTSENEENITPTSELDIDENLIGSLPLTVQDPLDNPSSAEKVALGRMLFWDPILSGNRDIACVTCHHPDNGYAEQLDLSIGVGGIGLSTTRSLGTQVKRNAPTIINTAFNGINVNGDYDPADTFMFWDNRSHSLEDQAIHVLKSAEEMRGDVFSEEDVVQEMALRLEAIPEYVEMFTSAFGDSSINGDRVTKAIASFERSIIANNSRFDRYARGEESALTITEVRGLNAFIESGCNACHSGPMFSDYQLHQLPVPDNDKLTSLDINDTGIEGKFRTPTLRNLEFTAPYMHNGTKSDLASAISFYKGIDNPANDPDLANLKLKGDDIDAINAFLLTLSDESFDKTIPESVPSGLNPGGDIN